MKLRTIITAVTAFISLGTQAQGEQGQLSLMPRVGFSLTKLSNDYFEIGGSQRIEKVSQRLKPALEAGVDLEYMATDFLGVTVGAKYSLQGSKFKDFHINVNPEASGDEMRFVNFSRVATDLHYLQVPLMLHLYVFKGLSIDAGVQFGHLLSAKESFNYVIGDLDTKTNKVLKYYRYTSSGIVALEDGEDRYLEHRETATDTYKRADVSIPLGLSYESDDVILSLRYNMGLNNISKEVEKMRNNVITFSVGYRIPLLGN